MRSADSALAIRRYGDERTRARVAHLRLGTEASAPSLGSGPDFSAWLTSLLPPEQRLGPVARALTASAASATAQPASASALALSTAHSDEADETPSAPSAAQLFGLSWRALGAEPDAWTGAKLTLAGEEPLSAQPIRSSPLRLLQEARQAYRASSAPLARTPRPE